jgi:N utilization substance protein A
MDSILAFLGLSPVEEFRVITATITAASADIATVTTRDGFTAVLPASEFYAGKPFVIGSTHQLLLLGMLPTPVVSAIRPELVQAIYAGFTPEIRTGAVRIMSVARAAGFRTKVAVAATTPNVDAVAALVGHGANRVKAVGLALGERLDIVPYHPVPETYLANALAPAAVSSVVISGDTATAFTPAHQMPAAVGQGGLNSQLAGQLLGLTVRIEAETQLS